MATRRTQFRRRKEPIQRQIDSAIPVRFVFQLPEYFTERRIRNVFGQIVVLNHPGHVQSFDKDRLVLADDLCGEFLKRVPSGVADPGVQPRHFEPGFLAIIATLDLARQATLKFLQPLFPPDERARVFEFLAVTGRGQGLNADVYADLGFGLLERLDVGFNEDTDKIAPARIPADRQIDEFCVVGKRAAPYNVQRLGLLGEDDPAVSIREGIRGIASRLASMLRFEGGILRPLFEEIREGRVKITQRLLKRDGTDFGKKGFLRLLFPFGEFRGGNVIADGFLLSLPGRGAIFQGPIVNIAGASEGLSELRRLLISGEESIFERLLDYHRDILHHKSNGYKCCQSWTRRRRCEIHLGPSSRYGWSILPRI